MVRHNHCFIPGCTSGYPPDRKTYKVEGKRNKSLFVPPLDFKILTKIGSGGFATVYRAVCLQPGYEDDHVAIKMINKKEVKKRRLKKRIVSEIEIHSGLSHPAIVQFFTWFEDADYYYLVLELCEGGSLEEYVRENGPVSEKDACDVITQVIDGVKYLHTRFILHRDLSLKNVLLTKNTQIKIADFGMAAKLMHPDEKKFTMLGTANFISPEVVRKESYDFKADCWSVGCVLYALLYGSPPFDGKEKKYMEIMNDAVMSPLKFPSSASNEAKALLEGLLDKNPHDRINILNPLQYPFFQKYQKTYDKLHEFPKGGDSGMSSLSSSKSSSRSHRSNQNALNLSRNDLKGVHDRYGYSVPTDLQRLHVDRPSSFHSGSCSSLLQHENQHYVCRHQDEKPRVKPPSNSSVFSSANQLKNRIQTLPSRQRIEECVQPVCSSQECEMSLWEHRNQNHKYCHKKQRPRYPERFESQIEDLPIQNHSNSPLPYPSHRLQNLIEDHLYSNSYYSGHSNVAKGYSHEQPSKQAPEYFPQASKCSHEYYCTPENHCSHELVCGCRHSCAPANRSKQSCHYSHVSCEDRNKDCIELVLERNPRVEEKRLKDVVDPLTTLRLPPKRYTTKNAIVSILNDGQVCIEFFRVKKHKKFVNRVCFISRDGWTILLYKPKKSLIPTNEPPPLPNNLREVQYFNFDTLPESHWKKYQYAKRFIDIVRAKTPKVTIYGKDCKCVMMENSPDPDYEVNFYNGGVVTCISGKTVFADRNGCSIDFTSPSDLSSEAQFAFDVYTTMKEKCKGIEASLEKLSENNSDINDTYFPVSVGRRSNASSGLQDTNKEISTPQSHCSSALNGAINAMKSYDGTMNTDSSPCNNSIQSSLPRGRTQSISPPFKSIVEILQDLKDLPKIENEKVVAEYKDGLQMWSSKDGQDVYFYDTRTKQKLTNIQNKEIMRRIQCDLTGILFHVLSSEGQSKR